MQMDDLLNTLPDALVDVSADVAAPVEIDAIDLNMSTRPDELGTLKTEHLETASPELEQAPDSPDSDEQNQENEAADSKIDTAVESSVISVGPLDLIELQSCLEALLFMADRPLSLKQLQEWVGSNFSSDLFHEALTSLKDRYQAPHHGMELIEVAGGMQLRTKIGRANLAQKLVKTQTQRLSAGAMETLAIIAYKQPAMKEDVDQVRGVDSSYFIRHLMEKKLIQISGRSELPGRPLLYSTTSEFLEIFGLKDLSALPSLNELSQMVPASEAGNPGDESPETREMRKLVNAMTTDRTSALYFNPAEDEKILKEIRDRVNQISTTTPYLDELKQNEKALQEAKTQVELTE